MAFEEAEAAVDQQEIHPENTSMPDPPPAYSSPKMEATIDVTSPAPISEPAPVIESVLEPQQEITIEPEVITEPEVVAQPEATAQPEVIAELTIVPEPMVVPEPTVVLKSTTVPEPTVIPEPITVPQRAVEPRPPIVAQPEAVAQFVVTREPLPSPQQMAIALPVISEPASAKRKKKSSKKIARDKTPDVPRKSELVIPVTPVVAPVLVADEPILVSPPIPAKSIAESAEKHPSPSNDPSPTPKLRSPKARTSVSIAPSSIDETVRSTGPGKSRSHAMPPLISIPVANPLHDPELSKPPATRERDHASEVEARSQPLPSPPVLIDDEPRMASPAPGSSSKPFEGFSPFRWFGFGAPVTPLTPGEKTPEPTLESEPTPKPDVAPQTEVTPPTPVSPAKEDKKAKKKEKSSKAVSVSTSNIVLTRASPSPSPAVEKIEWSRWPYRPATNMASSVEPKAEKPLAVRDSRVNPARSESHTATDKSGSSGTATPVATPMIFSPVVVAPVPVSPPPVTISAISAKTSPVTLARTAVPTASVPAIPVPIIPVIPALAVTPPVPTPRVDPHRAVSRDVRAPSTASITTQEATRPKDKILTREERKKERAEKRATAIRDASPMSHTPSVSFQSPRSLDEPLPQQPKPESNTRGRPTPRSILKQQSVDPAPSLSIPVVPSTRSSSQASRLEFTGSIDVPIYDDWEHAPKVHQELLAATSSVRSPRERRTPAASPISPGTPRSPAGDSRYRLRPTGSNTDSTTLSGKATPVRASSPSRDSKTTARSRLSQPGLVPVLNERVVRTKTTRPSRISTAVLQSPTETHVEPLASPILLTSENYCTRVPEGTIYQYDGMAPSPIVLNFTDYATLSFRLVLFRSL
ncbi:hypothetical protein FRC12_012651 [Ceratobasidium sp. 428]|nr:hypothetical protein FRC12_012651 [Ceratobasidium sp. 428]